MRFIRYILAIIVSNLIVSQYSIAQWKPYVGGNSDVLLPGRMLRFAVDKDDNVLVATRVLGSPRVMQIWEVKPDGTKTRLLESTEFANCLPILGAFGDNRRVVFSCNARVTITDLNTLESVAVNRGILNTAASSIIPDNNFTLIPDYASILSVSRIGYASTFFGGSAQTCDTSTTRLPVVSSIAYLGDSVIVTETNCYGTGSVWRVTQSKAERLTGWFDRPINIGDKLNGKMFRFPLVASNNKEIAVLSRIVGSYAEFYIIKQLQDNDIYIVGKLENSLHVASGNLLFGVGIGKENVFAFDYFGNYVYSHRLPDPFISQTATPTLQPTDTPAPTYTFTSTPTETPVETPTQLPGFCSELKEKLDQALGVAGCK